MSKRIMVVVLALAVAFGCFTIAVTAKGNEKVSVTLNSNDTDFLSAVVNADYSAEVTVPKGSVISAGELKGTISMTDIDSLGIEGTRTYSKGITTGVEKEVLLDNYLPAFTNATISGAVDGVDYKYNVVAEDTAEAYTITATPEDEDAVRAAYQAAASHITASTKAEDDSYALIPGTAYVQIGTEKLVFENTEETMKLDNIMQGTGLKAEIRSAVELIEADELEDAQVEVFLPAGTVLAVGQSIVTLDDAATIKMYGYEDNEDVNTILSKLRDCETNEQIILTAVLFISDFANAIEGQDLVVNVEFEETTTEISGSIDSALADKDTTIELVCDGEVVDSITASDSYSFDAVANGTYTIRVSKENHVTREYEIDVNGEVVIEDLDINLIGDVNGDDKLNVMDYAETLKHVRKTNALEGYAFDCADVNGDGKVTVSDYAAILRHVKKTANLW